jgi:hypothetical protein
MVNEGPFAPALTPFEMVNEIFVAKTDGDLPSVIGLLRQGAQSVNDTDVNGHTALWIAIDCYQFEIAQHPVFPSGT